jgi:hypothetical protein
LLRSRIYHISITYFKPAVLKYTFSVISGALIDSEIATLLLVAFAVTEYVSQTTQRDLASQNLIPFPHFD